MALRDYIDVRNSHKIAIRTTSRNFVYANISSTFNPNTDAGLYHLREPSFSTIYKYFRTVIGNYSNESLLMIVLETC